VKGHEFGLIGETPMEESDEERSRL
jgi:hypothetical protein